LEALNRASLGTDNSVLTSRTGLDHTSHEQTYSNNHPQFFIKGNGNYGVYLEYKHLNQRYLVHLQTFVVLFQRTTKLGSSIVVLNELFACLNELNE